MLRSWANAESTKYRALLAGPLFFPWDGTRASCELQSRFKNAVVIIRLLNCPHIILHKGETAWTGYKVCYILLHYCYYINFIMNMIIYLK
jgi:hypothetical protein